MPPSTIPPSSRRCARYRPAFFASACALALAACDAKPPPVPATIHAAAPVVGGRAEAGFPAVGYLLVGKSPTTLDGPSCGATLIAPDAVVTAAHCVRTGAFFGVAFGDAKKRGKVYPAKRVLAHSWYDPDLAVYQRYRHDVAVVVLQERIEGVTPAAIVPTPSACGARYVGYGRTTEGPTSVRTGYTGERKSAVECVERDDATNIFVTGRDGGLCWGDSGGPLLVDRTDGVLQIAGVLADFDVTFNCNVGNRMVFTSLARERDFIDCALRRGRSSDPGDTSTYADTMCHWAEPFIDAMRASGLVAVPAGGRLEPKKGVTRAELADLLVRAFKLVPARGATRFADVPIGPGAFDAIQSAYRAALLERYADGTFRPNDLVARVDVLSVLAKLLALPAATNTTRLSSFRDVGQIPGLAAGAVGAAIEGGVVVQDPTSDRLRPFEGVTRAELLAFVFLGRAALGLEEPIESPYVVTP